MKRKIAALIVLISTHIYAYDDCHPQPATAKNYIIGYGSLIQQQSRNHTNPEITKVTPIKAKGFIRDWDAIAEQYRITFLGAASCNSQDPTCMTNGVAYEVNSVDPTDAREGLYCRKKVPAKQLSTYKTTDKIDPTATYWIYVTRPEYSKALSSKFPINQSYVDIFLSGCMEQAADIVGKTADQLIYPNDYAYVIDCVKGTKNWNTDLWVNDRVHPSRPWSEVPLALKIDIVLSDSQKQGFIQGSHDYYDIEVI